jgi:hypothetical protein
VFDGSIIVFDANVAGMILYAHSDNASAAAAAASFASLGILSPEYKYKGASRSVLKDFMFYGGGGTSLTAHGLEVRSVVRLDNCRFDYFSASGCMVEASGQVETTPYGIADGSRFLNLTCRSNGMHGMFVRGNDANVIEVIGLDVAVNGGAGYLDRGQLGNKISGHAATNNQSYGAVSAKRTQILVDCPELSDQYAGSWMLYSAVGAHLLLACYIEGGVGFKAHAIDPTQVVGGNLASPSNFTATSTCIIYGPSSVYNLNTIEPTNSGTTEVSDGDSE